MCCGIKLLSQGVCSTQSIISNILKQEVKYNVYTPPSYYYNTKKYPVLYLLHGLYGNYMNWTDHNMAFTMDTVIANGAKEMIVIMPNGMDSWYCNNFDNRNLKYEDFMVQELIPQVESKYRIVSSRGSRAIAGLSMGGYGATYHAFKYRDMYSSCYSMSGALTGMAPSIEYLIDTLTTEQLQSLPAYTMEIGIQDQNCYYMNTNFHQFLNSKNIVHTYIERNGIHDWTFWEECLPKAIRFVSDNFETIPTTITSEYEFNDEIYPNPAGNTINISDIYNADVQIFDMSGRKVLQLAKVNYSIDVSSLNTGTYIVKLNNATNSCVKKIVKK